jgi:hypothetical protein
MPGISPAEFDILHETQHIRAELMDAVTDADLAYKLPGDNPTLGALCREMGQVEHTYTGSFRTLKHDWTYPAVDPGMETSVAQLKAWYATLDADLENTLLAYKDRDIQSLVVDRGWPMPFGGQFHTYREALLIFYGKATCYLRALGKPLPEQMRGWIG